MNKNKDYYKETFSAFTPSDTAVEKVFEATTDKKKKTSNFTFRRIAAAALAFVLIIGGGFGINSAVSKRNTVSDKLGVMVAMAGERDLLAAGKANEQDVFYGIYVADLEDKEAMRAAVDRWQRDKTKQNELGDEMEKKYGEKAITRSYSSSSGSCYSLKLEKDTAAIYTMRSGSFLLNKFDYSNVKDITIENTSQYGVLGVDYWDPYYDLSEMDMDIYDDMYGEDSAGWTHYAEYTFGTTDEKIVLTKEILTAGQEKEWGGLYTASGMINPGYSVDWDVSEYLKLAIGENVNFDLSQIKDTIIFTVHYEDGTSEQASVSLEFDSDGYMHIADAE